MRNGALPVPGQGTVPSAPRLLAETDPPASAAAREPDGAVRPPQRPGWRRTCTLPLLPGLIDTARIYSGPTRQLENASFARPLEVSMATNSSPLGATNISAVAAVGFSTV
jgi:hypothetical protein